MEAAQKLFPKINSIFESDMPLFQKIEHFSEEYITVMAENPYLPLFVLNEINQDPETFLNKIWGKQNLPRPQKFLEQIEKEVRKGTIKKVSPLHLLMNLISLSVFPFVGKSMFQFTLGLDELQYRAIMEQRKRRYLNLLLIL